MNTRYPLLNGTATLCMALLLAFPAKAQRTLTAYPAVRTTSAHSSARAGHAIGLRTNAHRALRAPHQLPIGVVKPDADQHQDPIDSRSVPPANDNCANAVTLPVNSSCVTTSGTVLNATQSIPAVSCNGFTGNANDDVWYKFVANAASLVIDLACNSSFDGVLDLRSGACNGTNIACGDAFVAGGSEEITATGLTIGSTYYVRVYDYAAGYPTDPTFTICVHSASPAPPNDLCSGATVNALASSGDQVTINDDNTGATDSEGNGFNTIWEAFSIDGCANVTIDYCGTVGFAGFLTQIAQGCPVTSVIDSTSTGDCGDGNLLITFASLAAGTYYVPVYEGPGVQGPFTMTISTTPCGGSVPYNDVCANANIENLGVPGTVSVNGDNTGATDSEGIGYNTVWEAFTIGSCANVTVDYCGTSPAFGQYFVNLVSDCALTTLYDTTSTSACGDGNGSLYFAGLQAGTYYFPVLQSNLATGPYTINFTATACGGGSYNDLCSQATPQLLTVGSTITFVGDNSGCTDSEGLGFANSWESFTTSQCMDITWDFCGSDSSMLVYTNLFIGCPWTNFSSSCGTVPTINCSGGVATSPQANATSVPPGTYYIVIPYEGIYGGAYNINVSGTACAATPPGNDNCAQAVPLTVGLTCTPTIGTTNGATRSSIDLACNGFTGLADDDVWYSFVPVTPGGTITVTPTDSLDAVIQLYSGTCAGLTPLDCADAGVTGDQEQLVYSGLAVGNTYYYRVYSFGLGTYCDGNFTTCVTEDPSTGVGTIAANGWTVFPNPTDGGLSILSGNVSGNTTIELFDMTGRAVISEQRILSAGGVTVLPIGNGLAAGTYDLRLTSASGRSEQRVMVK